MLSQCLKVKPGARPGSADSTPQAGPPRMRALALGGRVGIESQPRNKYSLGTRARAFSGLLPHSWPCGSSRTLRSPAAATGDLMTVSWEPRASCQPAQPWPGPQACFSLQIIKPQPWATSPPLALCWRDRGRASGRVIPRLSFHASGKNEGRMQGPAYPPFEKRSWKFLQETWI